MNLATRHQLECAELATLNARTDQRIMAQRILQAEKRTAEAQKRRRDEKARHEAEMQLVLYGTAVVGCIITALTCFLAAPWWTGIAPIALALLLLRRAGW